VSQIMHSFETASITVPYRKRCEDRVAVIGDGDRVVIAVADGAGGSGAGEQAAEAVIREITASVSLAHDQESCCRLLAQIDCRIGDGESTAVVVAVSPDGIFGASVGDSKAWLIQDGELTDLTVGQVRKPLLGSGSARPVGFAHGPLQGLLIVATDGFCNYVKQPALLREIYWIDFEVLPCKLVEMVRLRSGELWDDVGIVVCRQRPAMHGRKVYDLSEGSDDPAEGAP
jgi:serine/threonine protein phosphatase PrpC